MTFRIADARGYYPRARVRVIARLEDFGLPGTPDPPPRIPTLRKGSKDLGKPGQLKVIQQEGGAYVLVQPTSTGTTQQFGGPQDQTTSLDKLTHVIDGIVPQSATWEVNGPRTADTLDLTLSLADFPFDPRCFRSIAVKFFLGCIPAGEAERLGEFRPPDSTNLALPFSTVPDTWIDRNGRQRTNLRFQGFVDENTMVLDRDSGQVNMTCIDNTSLLLTQEHPTMLYVDPKKPIDQAIANYLASFPQFIGLEVEYRPHVTEDKKPLLASAMAKSAAHKGKGPPQGAGQKVMVWDYLTDVVGMVGHIIRVEGVTLVIQRPRTLFEDGFHREDDPFHGRVIEGQGEPPLVLPVRMYAWGANAMKLSIGRSYEHGAPKNIEVRSYSTNRKKTLIVRYPDKQQGRVKNMKPGQTGTDLKFEVIRVHGVDDEASLRIIAQAHYEAENRNEFDIQLDTVNLGSFGGDNLDPDLLDAREGDAIQIQIIRDDSPDGIGKAANLAWATEEELVGMGFQREFAQAYIRVRSSLSLPTTFRMREGRYSWTNDKAVNVSLRCVNYVVASISKELPEGEELEPSDQQPGPDRVNVDTLLG